MHTITQVLKQLRLTLATEDLSLHVCFWQLVVGKHIWLHNLRCWLLNYGSQWLLSCWKETHLPNFVKPFWCSVTISVLTQFEQQCRLHWGCSVYIYYIFIFRFFHAFLVYVTNSGEEQVNMQVFYVKSMTVLVSDWLFSWANERGGGSICDTIGCWWGCQTDTVQDNVLVLQRKHLDNSYTLHEYNTERRYSDNGAIMYT